jgi:L-alanine-DL-glutamate epimerase-like enolase superfamily enzyme
VRSEGLIEVFYMKRAASLWGDHLNADASGGIAVPQGLGLGYEPDREVMEKYRVS